MSKRLLLAGEPMGLLIAKQEGALETVKDYSMAVAGAEFNVATGISRLCHKVSYLTKLGNDPFGKLVDLFFLVSLDYEEWKSGDLVIIGNTEICEFQKAFERDLCKCSRDRNARSRTVADLGFCL